MRSSFPSQKIIHSVIHPEHRSMVVLLKSASLKFPCKTSWNVFPQQLFRAFYQHKPCFAFLSFFFLIWQAIDTLCTVLSFLFWLWQLNRTPQYHILWTHCPHPDTMNNGFSVKVPHLIYVCSKNQIVGKCSDGGPISSLWRIFLCQDV